MDCFSQLRWGMPDPFDVGDGLRVFTRRCEEESGGSPPSSQRLVNTRRQVFQRANQDAIPPPPHTMFQMGRGRAAAMALIVDSSSR